MKQTKSPAACGRTRGIRRFGRCLGRRIPLALLATRVQPETPRTVAAGGSEGSLRSCKTAPNLSPANGRSSARRQPPAESLCLGGFGRLAARHSTVDPLPVREVPCHTNPGNKNPRFPGILEPSDGLEPSIPSLPWKFRGGTVVHARSRASTFRLQIEALGCVSSARACPSVLDLMYPSRTRGLLSVLTTDNGGDARPTRGRGWSYLQCAGWSREPWRRLAVTLEMA